MSSHLHSADKITTDGGKLSTHGLIKFLVPSLIGILLFRPHGLFGSGVRI